MCLHLSTWKKNENYNKGLHITKKLSRECYCRKKCKINGGLRGL